ncbi:c-type cytochrome [Pleomorphovibrio marinus]|uniref:c-type cytochrome n=1 Tax=Pleomorphovibrio marinus TaxID=2164132 RepID=UPI001E599958|nr:c-type cytochrome [Pleomorphovibrio marinus]
MKTQDYFVSFISKSKYLLLKSLVVWIGIASCQPKAEIERPLDPWAFRSVLDKKPRMLTLALDSACYVAYDLAKPQLYKVWKGGVLLEGTVYTNKKNIQPTSWGTSYLEDKELYNRWRITKEGVEVAVSWQYKGYRIRDNQIFISYEASLEDGSRARIEEQPEFVRSREGKPGLERRINIKDLPDGYTLHLCSEVDCQQWEETGEQVLRTYFASLPEQEPPSLGDKYDHLGILKMEMSDCYTCHEEHHKMVGPSFEEIAAKYPDKKKFSSYLTKKIQEGGAGVWGEIPMNEHPELSESDIRPMLDYIYSLKPAEAKQSTGSAPIQNASLKEENLRKPGFGVALEGLHPSYNIQTLHFGDFKPRVGAIAFLPDGRLLVSTWDRIGGVYLLDGVQEGDTTQIQIKRIAEGLAEPLGLEVVDGEIYVLQKHELTHLVDTDGDDIIDEYRVVSDAWGVTDDFHEFAFGLVHDKDKFYITTSMAMRLMSHQKQHPDRGRTLEIGKDGSYRGLDYGLRTPNGIGKGVDGELFVTDNQGQWLPGNKLIHVKEGAYNGMAWGVPDSLKEIPEMVPPAIWLPDAEIGNSPSEPILMKDGPYKGQMLHGDVTHGGIKRDFLEKINGIYQGVVFRFSQGFSAGVNRLAWGPDEALYVGEVGMVGGWSWKENQYGLEKITYNGKPTFEMLAVRAKKDGFEIEFTEPLSKRGITKEDLLVQQWWYEPTSSYGGPKKDLTDLFPEEIELSEDRKKCRLVIPGLREEHVVYFLLSENILNEHDKPLWSGEAWYTLNKIPNSNEE